jgi:CrcB protein
VVWKEICLLAVAGAAGTLFRFGLTGFVQSLTDEKFPWGTLAVNVTGCFLFGLIWMLAEERLVISGQSRFIILTGFLGALTTFSTMSYETVELLRDSQWWQAGVNLLANNGLGILGLFLGFAIGRWL